MKESALLVLFIFACQVLGAPMNEADTSKNQNNVSELENQLQLEALKVDESPDNHLESRHAIDASERDRQSPPGTKQQIYQQKEPPIESSLLKTLGNKRFLDLVLKTFKTHPQLLKSFLERKKQQNKEAEEANIRRQQQENPEEVEEYKSFQRPSPQMELTPKRVMKKSGWIPRRNKYLRDPVANRKRNTGPAPRPPYTSYWFSRPVKPDHARFQRPEEGLPIPTESAAATKESELVLMKKDSLPEHREDNYKRSEQQSGSEANRKKNGWNYRTGKAVSTSYGLKIPDDSQYEMDLQRTSSSQKGENPGVSGKIKELSKEAASRQVNGLQQETVKRVYEVLEEPQLPDVKLTDKVLVENDDKRNGANPFHGVRHIDESEFHGHIRPEEGRQIELQKIVVSDDRGEKLKIKEPAKKVLERVGRIGVEPKADVKPERKGESLPKQPSEGFVAEKESKKSRSDPREKKNRYPDVSNKPIEHEAKEEPTVILPAAMASAAGEANSKGELEDHEKSENKSEADENPADTDENNETAEKRLNKQTGGIAEEETGERRERDKSEEDNQSNAKTISKDTTLAASEDNDKEEDSGEDGSNHETNEKDHDDKNHKDGEDEHDREDDKDGEKSNGDDASNKKKDENGDEEDVDNKETGTKNEHIRNEQNEVEETDKNKYLDLQDIREEQKEIPITILERKDTELPKHVESVAKLDAPHATNIQPGNQDEDALMSLAGRHSSRNRFGGEAAEFKGHRESSGQ